MNMSVSKFDYETPKAFTDPPPPGVQCECEKECACDRPDLCEHPLSHWHTRFMVALCDGCGRDFRGDFHVYTRAEGVAAVQRHVVDSLGWTVNTHGWFCPDCEPTPWWWTL